MNALFPPSADAVRLLQEYLDHSIPLVTEMQARVHALDDAHLVLAAPLEPNRNHIGTVFGGSLNTLATLACWGLVWLTLHGREAHIVIQEGRMKFNRPASEAFSAYCVIPPAHVLEDFVGRYERRGKARLELGAQIVSQETVVAEFDGTFVAIDPARARP